MQYKTLRLFKDNGVVGIAVSSNTSHVTQPPDVTVFSSYKSFLQQELHRAARQKNKLNVFNVGQCIKNDYARSRTAPNIIPGFQKTGIWDPELLSPNIEPLRKYMSHRNGGKVSDVTVAVLVEKFKKSGRF